MPGGNQTGPMGMGPRTGRGAGYCSGYGTPGFANPSSGRGFVAGMGRGRGVWGRGSGGGGRGWRNLFHATGQPGWMRSGGYAPPAGYPAPYQQADPDMEKRALKSQAEALKAELNFIEKRLAEVDSANVTD